jgi:hypothetical protein
MTPSKDKGKRTMSTSIASSDTAIGAALARAGYLSPAERLQQVVERVLKAHDTRAAQVEAIWAIVQKDKDLLIEMVAPRRAAVIEDLLRSAMAQAAAGREGQSTTAEKAGRSSPSRTPSPQGERAGHLGIAEKAKASAPARTSSPPGAPRVSAAALRAVGQVEARAILRTFLIDGRALGDCLVREARSWAAKRARDARFIDMLTAGMQQDMVIGRHCTEKDAMDIWVAANRSWSHA